MRDSEYRINVTRTDLNRISFVKAIGYERALSLFVIEDAVLVTGWKHLTLVSLKDGTVLASHSIPCEPLSPVIHGDFTNDGLMDFVVHCKAR